MNPAKTFTQPELNRVLGMHERRSPGQNPVRTELHNAKLDRLNLANRDLAGLDLTGASLVGAMLFGSNLSKAKLLGTDLRRSDMRNANLTGADLRGALLNHANLCFALLDNADMRSVVMMNRGAEGMWVLDHQEHFFGGRAKEVGADFSNCSMKCVSFTNAELHGADFTSALLHGAKFEAAKIFNAKFKGAVLTGVNLKDLAVTASMLKDCVLDVQKTALDRAPQIKAALDDHHSWVCSNGRNGAPAILDGEDLRPLQSAFRGRSLAAVSARNALAIGVDFSGCQLQGSRLDGSDLRDANFDAAELAGASFRNAKLGHAIFDRAIISRLTLLTGNHVMPDFTGAEIVENQFSRAIVESGVAIVAAPPA